MHSSAELTGEEHLAVLVDFLTHQPASHRPAGDSAHRGGMPGSGSSGEARREPLDAMTQLSQGRVEAARVASWYRVGN